MALPTVPTVVHDPEFEFLPRLGHVVVCFLIVLLCDPRYPDWWDMDVTREARS